MLSEREKEGLETILQKLENDVLASMTNTVTQRLITAETRQEAIKAILSYSTTAASLLKRKKMLKEIIFHYLKENDVIVPVSAGKSKMIEACLNFWGSNITKDIYEDDSMDFDESFVTFSPTPGYSAVPAELNNDCLYQITINQELSPSFCHLSEDQLLEEMGRKFSVWFHDLLNKSGTATGGDFGPQHFWPDCDLVFTLEEGASRINKHLFGAEQVCMLFSSLAKFEHLFFDPNLLKCGTSCSAEVHGLIKITVSGVVHKHSNCVGLFDEVFGLVRNPNSDNIWRIKYCELRLNMKKAKLEIQW